MKTIDYNPSPLEVELAETLSKLTAQIEEGIPGIKVVDVVNRIEEDNPLIRYYIIDKDGDTHELAVRIIQTPDRYVQTN